MCIPKKIGFIGLGLIGGSLAKAIRRVFPTVEIVAFDKSPETLAFAMQTQMIDFATTGIDEHFCHCDFIFLCAPVAWNNTYLRQLQPVLHPDLILTDVGSVKQPIHETVSSLEMDSYFIGGHPMTGSEKSGIVNSKEFLFENAYYILTPTASVSHQKVERFTRFLTALKALPVKLDATTHDRLTGTVSHLPHIIAATLVNFVKEHDTPDQMMKQLAAGGFKDITRIASSSPLMWQQICLTNQEEISNILEQYIHSLQQAKDLLDTRNKDGIFDLFDHSRTYRNSIPESVSGSIRKIFAIYCDIIDETGGIATIATILATNQINIKNIGIVHNREFEEGVLRIEFYEESASEKAVSLLQKHRYLVYKQ